MDSSHGNSCDNWETKQDFIKDSQNKTNKVEERQHQRRRPNSAVSHCTFTYYAELQGSIGRER
jgi:hypothetical protein